MNLANKKRLVARTVGVGKERVSFNNERLNEIKEALTKQDVRELVENGAIRIAEIKGKKRLVKRKTKRKQGSVKKRVRNRKRNYMIITRKLRAHIVELKKHEVLSQEEYIKLRTEIKASLFRSKAHMKERINHMIKERK